MNDFNDHVTHMLQEQVEITNSTNLDGHNSSLWEFQEMAAKLLHSSSEEFDVGDGLQPFHQSSGPVVYAHPGYYLGDKRRQNKAKVKNNVETVWICVKWQWQIVELIIYNIFGGLSTIPSMPKDTLRYLIHLYISGSWSNNYG